MPHEYEKHGSVWGLICKRCKLHYAHHYACGHCEQLVRDHADNGKCCYGPCHFMWAAREFDMPCEHR